MMVTVDIYVPALNKSYDFNLDEDVQIGAIIEEISEMICRKERWPEPDRSSALSLFCPEFGNRLPLSGTLRGAGICTGNRLMLV